ncbi:MAG: DUF2911 domain-containing protein [Cytophagales bacterium]|nr:MAG: DUF2911 domain-containing protein [Cytophagales bacterium]
MNRNRVFLFLFSLLLTVAAQAQNDPAQRPSPPATATQTVNGKTITIQYGQPSVKGREVWGKLVPYGAVWRAGANETTAFTTSGDVTVEGKSLPAGKYAFFVIPTEKDWTVVFNKTVKWGAFSYKQDEDVLRVTVPAKTAKAPVEQLTYTISPKGNVTLSWADKQATFRVK